MLPSSLERAVYGVVVTPALHVADRHGVFAHLSGNGPADAEGLAKALGVEAETLERILLVLAAYGILHRAPDGGYGVPAEARPFLDPGDDRYIGGFVAHMVEETADRIGRLDSYLTRGKAAADRGLPAPFETIYRDAAATRDFMSAMWDLSFGASKEIAALADLSRTARLVDVGGASGPFATAALLRAPGLRATVFDLPGVGPHVAETAERYGLAGRLGFTAGDFFTEELPAGDCIAFGYILSDWDDDACAMLLAKAYRACTPPGRVLIMERLFDDSRTGPLATAVMNLTMHVETQGRHRTAAEYTALLEEAGFTGCEVHRTSGEKHLVVGHRR
ncbi:methyltransferase [Actinomadura algeriensis]|uniref:Transcriptional regulator n=1 Tax=Actinomadura algeriensis TaxID=1679523 RepID=A0ABR9JU60_9ACTN|nr:methyltransferase [Actinomadura algeriensis]MBE1533911.1 putative transcriptional regulator [Actinomadura algeriensis]